MVLRNRGTSNNIGVLVKCIPHITGNIFWRILSPSCFAFSGHYLYISHDRIAIAWGGGRAWTTHGLAAAAAGLPRVAPHCPAGVWEGFASAEIGATPSYDGNTFIQESEKQNTKKKQTTGVGRGRCVVVITAVLISH